MSHELRTPLNAILGFSEVLRGELFGPLGGGKYLEYASDIHTSAEHLLALVNDMLDVSAIEAGQWRLHRETVAIGELIGDCVEIMSERAARKRITLTMKIPMEPLFVSLDKRAFKQILLNLLTNSVKFTLVAALPSPQAPQMVASRLSSRIPASESRRTNCRPLRSLFGRARRICNRTNGVGD